MPNQLQDKEKQFIEEVGMVFEQTGLPRMAGRVFGRLLICQPAYQSPSELADALIRIVSDAGLRQRFSGAGRRFVESRSGGTGRTLEALQERIPEVFA